MSGVRSVVKFCAVCKDGGRLQCLGCRCESGKTSFYQPVPACAAALDLLPSDLRLKYASAPGSPDQQPGEDEPDDPLSEEHDTEAGHNIGRELAGISCSLWLDTLLSAPHTTCWPCRPGSAQYELGFAAQTRTLTCAQLHLSARMQTGARSRPAPHLLALPTTGQSQGKDPMHT